MSVLCCETCSHFNNYVFDSTCMGCYRRGEEPPSNWQYRKGSLTNYDLVVKSNVEKLANFLSTVSQKPWDYEEALEFLQSEPWFPTQKEK